MAEKKGHQFRDYLGFAWQIAFRHRTNLGLGLTGCAVAGGIWQAVAPVMPLPSNAWWATGIVAGCAALAGILIYTVALVAYAPLHFRLEPHGGFVGVLGRKLGAHMGPILLMISGVVAFVILSGAGLVWFMVQASSTGALTTAGPLPAIASSQPDFKLVPTHTYNLRFSPQTNMQIMIRKAGDTGYSYELPTLILKNQNAISVADATVKWRVELSDIERLVKTSTLLSKYKPQLEGDRITLMALDSGSINFSYWIKTNDEYKVPFIASDTLIPIPLTMSGILPLFLADRLPNKIGEKSTPLTYSASVEWNIPAGGKAQEFKVTVTATNTKSSGADTDLEGIVDFKAERIN